MARTEKLLQVVCILLLVFITENATASVSQTLLDILKAVRNIEELISARDQSGSFITDEFDESSNVNTNQNVNSNSNVNRDVDSLALQQKNSSRRNSNANPQNEFDNEAYRDTDVKLTSNNGPTKYQDLHVLPARLAENYDRPALGDLMGQSNVNWNANTNTNLIKNRRFVNNDHNYNANSNVNQLEKKDDGSIIRNDTGDEYRRFVIKKTRRSKNHNTSKQLHNNSNLNKNINSNFNLNSNQNRRSNNINSNSNQNWNTNNNQNEFDVADFDIVL